MSSSPFRGRELVPEGRLMVLTVGRDELGEIGMRPLIDGPTPRCGNWRPTA